MMYSGYRLQRVRLYQVFGYYEKIVDSHIKKIGYNKDPFATSYNKNAFQ